jgi:thiol:disulfide interchange protein DsbD
VEGVLQIRPAKGPTQNYVITASPATGDLSAVARDELAKIAMEVPAQRTDVPDDADLVQGPAVQIAYALWFALIGGFLLNLMPCVFPVLSLKAMALMRSAETDQHEQRRQALAYSAGAILSCVTAAAVLLALRAGGEALGWGFQLQSPIFVAAMIYLLMLLGLSMSGVLELGAGLMGAGGSLAQRPGLSGAFFTGVLAVVVASPCTAPFMGTALGFAITQPLAIALTVFAALGLGLALPFLLLGFYPRLGRMLPRPGTWMLRFKQAMAFPIYLTCVWLTWVLIRQAGASAFLVVAIGAVLLAMGAWLIGLQPRSRSATALALLAFAATAASLALPVFRSRSDDAAQITAPVAASADGIQREAWSSERLAQLRRDGRTVFVNFTADWCITCKLNERGALQAESVLAQMRAHNVVWLTGDWTRANPLITEELAKFARNGVPLYLIYGAADAPQVLPQVLTPADLTQALRMAPKIPSGTRSTGG